jgi:hypothetical protein
MPGSIGWLNLTFGIQQWSGVGRQVSSHLFYTQIGSSVYKNNKCIKISLLKHNAVSDWRNYVSYTTKENSGTALSESGLFILL